jgi:hypothetical protein
MEKEEKAGGDVYCTGDLDTMGRVGGRAVMGEGPESLTKDRKGDRQTDRMREIEKGS